MEGGVAPLSARPSAAPITTEYGNPAALSALGNPSRFTAQLGQLPQQPSRTSHPPTSADDVADMPQDRRRSPGARHKWSRPPAPRRAIRPLLLLVALVNLAWSLYQLPVSRVVESRLCREHYAAHDPSALRPDGSVPEELCKIDDVQQRLGRIQGVMETLWVAGGTGFAGCLILGGE